MIWSGLSHLVVVGLLSAPTIAALNLQERKPESHNLRVVSLPTQRHAVSNPLLRDRVRRRDETVGVKLDNMETLYSVNATLGTPPQSLRLHLDTGSSDLWVNTPESDLCSQENNPCAAAGTYTANSSSSYSYIGSYFNISYVDGSSANGDYVKDTITIGSSTLDDFQFGIGYTTSTDQGILGLGYPLNEVQVGRAGMDPYKNLPAKMVSAGQIHSKAFSLWLNDLDASTGQILFGGVDTEQYHDELQTLPVQANGGSYAEFLITLTGLHVGDTVIAEDIAQAVLLDSGSSLTYLPNSIATDLFDAVGAQFDQENNAAYVPCSLRESTEKLVFTFSSPQISVDMTELTLDMTTSDGSAIYFVTGERACLFGVVPAGTGTKVLGDTFLRSAYVVYDIDNNEISLAQTNFNATKTNVLEISGAGQVPGATRISDTVQATQGVMVSETGTTSANSEDKGSFGVKDASFSSLLLTLACSLGVVFVV